MQTLVALYHNFVDAQNAVDELVRSGVDRTKISLVANNATGAYSDYVNSDYDSEDAVTAEQGAAFGAASGGIIGALAGLGALAIPGIGPVIAAGPLIAALTGGAVGVLAGAPTGGLVAGLIKTHYMDAEDAEVYAEGVRRGETLLTVQVDDTSVSRTRDMLNKYHPTDVHNEVSTWRQAGWTKFDESTTPSTEETESHRERPSSTSVDTSLNSARTQPSRPVADTSAITERKSLLPAVEEDVTPHDTEKNHVRVYSKTPDFQAVDETMNSGFNNYNQSFRTDYQTRFGRTGLSYDVYMPAYRYGYTLASDPTYKGKDWATIESDARSQWQHDYPETLWDDIKDAIHYAWDTVTGRR